MDSLLTGIIIVPGIAGALFLLVISYLQHQLREPAYRIWDAVWAFYIVYVTLLGFELTILPNAFVLYLARVFMIATVMALLVSRRPMQTSHGAFRLVLRGVLA